jgi:hypothetical protein
MLKSEFDGLVPERPPFTRDIVLEKEWYGSAALA